MDPVVNWVESCIGRKLTEEEIKRIEENAKRSKEINTGSVEVLKRYGIDLMPNTFNQSCLEKERIIFKLACIYQAKTELYDRTLTSRRSLYDPTEAFLDNGFVRSQSNKYARTLRETIVEFARLKLDIPTDEFRKSFNQIEKSYHYTAQGWIDVYNHFKENGEMEFFEKWHKGWKPIEQVKEIGERVGKIEVANFESDWRKNAVYLEDDCK